jgi:tRNA G46 methylase TrmB
MHRHFHDFVFEFWKRSEFARAIMDVDDFRRNRKAKARAAKALPKRFVELSQKCIKQLNLNADTLHSEPLWTSEDVDSIQFDADYANPLQFMNNARALHKRQQLANLILSLQFLKSQNVISPDAKVADLCSGSGHVGFSIAEHFPQMKVLLVEINPNAVETARQRAKFPGEDRVQVFHQSILAFQEPCDVVVALHACGRNAF